MYMLSLDRHSIFAHFRPRLYSHKRLSYLTGCNNKSLTASLLYGEILKGKSCKLERFPWCDTNRMQMNSTSDTIYNAWYDTNATDIWKNAKMGRCDNETFSVWGIKNHGRMEGQKKPNQAEITNTLIFSTSSFLHTLLQDWFTATIVRPSSWSSAQALTAA